MYFYKEYWFSVEPLLFLSSWIESLSLNIVFQQPAQQPFVISGRLGRSKMKETDRETDMISIRNRISEKGFTESIDETKKRPNLFLLGKSSRAEFGYEVGGQICLPVEKVTRKRIELTEEKN